jgi:hypothetical protein
MPDEIVGGGAVASADPVRDAVANSVADAGMIDEIASSSNEVVETPPANGADGSATPAETPVATTPDAPKPETPAAPKAKTEDEEVAEIEAKLVAENPSLQRGNISRSRHQAMLTRRANEHKAALEPLQAKAAQFDAPETQERLSGALIFEQRPDVAFEKVLLHDPRYVALIDAHVEKVIKERGLSGAPTAQQPSATAAPSFELPKPDMLNPDGSLGYSAEAQAAYVEAKLQQQRADMQAEFDKKLEDRFKAIDGDLAPAREAKAVKETFEKALTSQGALLDEAHRSWPNFKGHFDEIKAELGKKGNERMGLRQAYDAVRERHITTLQGQVKTQAQLEAEMRTRIIQETNAAATAAGRSLRPGVPAAGAPSGDGFATDPIRDAVAKAASTLR